MKILLVEDDEMTGASLRDFLQDEGYEVCWVQDGSHVKVCLLAEKPAVVILDLGLPDKDGLDVLREIRSAGLKTPVLITSARDTVADRVRGLDCGADDYLVKPYNLNELLARIRALFRRAGSNDVKIMNCGLLRIYPETREVLFKGKHITLSDKEYRLITTLAEKKDTVFSRRQLQSHLYNSDMEIVSNAIEVHIHNLRKKLSDQAIKTVRGIGYQMGY